MIKYKYICIRFIVDKNVKIYKKESSNKLYCKNKINTENGKKTCMIALNNYIKKRKKLMLSKHNKKQVPKKSSKKKTNPTCNNSKKKTNSSQNNSKKKTRNTLRGKKYNKIKGGGLTFREDITPREISALMVDEEDPNQELGHFSLRTTEPYDLSIHIDETYQNRKLSIKLLELFYYLVTRRYDYTDMSGNRVYKFSTEFSLKDSDILYIDTDASGSERGPSFWDFIGMKPNRQCERQNPNCKSRGYEKSITLKDLLINIEKFKIKYVNYL